MMFCDLAQKLRVEGMMDSIKNKRAKTKTNRLDKKASITRKTGINVGIFTINVTKLEHVLMCLKNQIVVVKYFKKNPHFGTKNYHAYSELFHVYSGFSSNSNTDKWRKE